MVKRNAKDDPALGGEWPVIPGPTPGLSKIEKAILAGFLLGLVGALVLMLSIERC